MNRTDLLVHWKGRDIHTDMATLTDDHRRRYVERLMDIVGNGFWMTRPPENLTGAHVVSSSGTVSFTYSTDMTCFTELRLSASGSHAKAFGLLGLSVSRRYVLDRWGAPVHYVRNAGDERIVGAFIRLRYLVGRLCRTGAKEADEAIGYVDYLGAFLKAMSCRGRDDYRHLDEQEWRVVVTEPQLKKGTMVATGHHEPEYRLKLSPGDLRLVVFPDAETRSMAVARDEFQAFRSATGDGPHLLTVQECEQF